MTDPPSGAISTPEFPAAGDGRVAPISIAILGEPTSVHVRRWVEYFAGRGHRVTLLVPEGQDFGAAFPPSVEIARYAPNQGWRIRQLGIIASGLSVRRVIRRVRPDVLHAHYLTLNGPRAWMSGFHPYVVTVWGNDVLIDPARNLGARVLARITLRSADLVTGISRHVVDAAVRCGARPVRCRVIHFGVDVDQFSPGPDPAALRERLGLAGKRVIFSPRIIDTIYRHDVVIDALAALPDDVALVMSLYAASSREVVLIQQRINDLALADRIRFVSPIPPGEMADYYRLADAVVSVPSSDAGPVTLVEALAVGKPIVCSDLPPVREWLGNLDPACLVPVGDVQATAAALRAVLERGPDERAERARAGRAEVVGRADRRRTMAEFEGLYTELAARWRTRAGR